MAKDNPLGGGASSDSLSFVMQAKNLVSGELRTAARDFGEMTKALKQAQRALNAGVSTRSVDQMTAAVSKLQQKVDRFTASAEALSRPITIRVSVEANGGDILKSLADQTGSLRGSSDELTKSLGELTGSIQHTSQTVSSRMQPAITGARTDLTELEKEVNKLSGKSMPEYEKSMKRISADMQRMGKEAGTLRKALEWTKSHAGRAVAVGADVLGGTRSARTSAMTRGVAAKQNMTPGEIRDLHKTMNEIQFAGDMTKETFMELTDAVSATIPGFAKQPKLMKELAQSQNNFVKSIGENDEQGHSIASQQSAAMLGASILPKEFKMIFESQKEAMAQSGQSFAETSSRIQEVLPIAQQILNRNNDTSKMSQEEISKKTAEIVMQTMGLSHAMSKASKGAAGSMELGKGVAEMSTLKWGTEGQEKANRFKQAFSTAGAGKRGGEVYAELAGAMQKGDQKKVTEITIRSMKELQKLDPRMMGGFAELFKSLSGLDIDQHFIETFQRTPQAFDDILATMEDISSLDKKHLEAREKNAKKALDAQKYQWSDIEKRFNSMGDTILSTAGAPIDRAAAEVASNLLDAGKVLGTHANSMFDSLWDSLDPLNGMDFSKIPLIGDKLNSLTGRNGIELGGQKFEAKDLAKSAIFSVGTYMAGSLLDGRLAGSASKKSVQKMAGMGETGAALAELAGSDGAIPVKIVSAETDAVWVSISRVSKSTMGKWLDSPMEQLQIFMGKKFGMLDEDCLPVCSQGGGVGGAVGTAAGLAGFLKGGPLGSAITKAIGQTLGKGIAKGGAIGKLSKWGVLGMQQLMSTGAAGASAAGAAGASAAGAAGAGTAGAGAMGLAGTAGMGAVGVVGSAALVGTAAFALTRVVMKKMGWDAPVSNFFHNILGIGDNKKTREAEAQAKQLEESGVEMIQSRTGNKYGSLAEGLADRKKIWAQYDKKYGQQGRVAIVGLAKEMNVTWSQAEAQYAKTQGGMQEAVSGLKANAAISADASTSSSQVAGALQSSDLTFTVLTGSVDKNTVAIAELTKIFDETNQEELRRRKSSASGQQVSAKPTDAFLTGGKVGQTGVAQIHKDEFVIKKSSADKIGGPALNKMNAGQSPVVKAGANITAVSPTMMAGLSALNSATLSAFGVPVRVTAGTDGKHRPQSAHYSGKALDVTLAKGDRGASQSSAFAKLAKDTGFGFVKDEWKSPSAYASGGHLHLEGFKAGAASTAGQPPAPVPFVPGKMPPATKSAASSTPSMGLPGQMHSSGAMSPSPAWSGGVHSPTADAAPTAVSASAVTQPPATAPTQATSGGISDSDSAAIVAAIKEQTAVLVGNDYTKKIWASLATLKAAAPKGSGSQTANFNT